MKPNEEFDLECHVDVVLAGLGIMEGIVILSHEKLRTRYVISLSKCPIPWIMFLQTDIAGSKIEAEYSALSVEIKDVISIQLLIKVIGSYIKIEEATKKHIQDYNLGRQYGFLETHKHESRSVHTKIKALRSKIQSVSRTHLRLDTSQVYWIMIAKCWFIYKRSTISSS